MFSKKEIIMLKNVVERLRTDNRMLRERIAENNETRTKIDEKLKSDINRFRKFCEKILAMYRSETAPGREVAFNELSNTEICVMADNAYDRYNEERTNLIKEFLKKYEEQGRELDGLKLQFSRLLNGEQQVALEIVETAPEPRETKSENGMIEVDMYNVRDVACKFNELAWLILEVLGVFGLSLRKEIIAKCLELAKERKLKANFSTVSRELNALENIPDMFIVDKIPLPASGIVNVVRLGRTGTAVFENRFREPPVKSEAKRIIEEHDNLKHGYGIVSLGRTLRANGIFKTVDYMNKGKGIEVVVDGRETVYVPDLVCVDKYGNRYYYEYELANHNMKNFRYKCDKMVQVSSVLRFVVPNKEIAGQLKPKIQNWINHRGQLRLRDTRVEVHTYMSLVEGKLPTLEYDLNTSAAPVRDWT